MAKKIDASLAKKLKSLKITAKTEDEARKKLLAVLEKEGVEGMDDEDTDTLIDMVDSFVNDEKVDETETDEVDDTEGEVDETEEEPEEVDDEEKEADDLAEEVAGEETEAEDDGEEEPEEEVDETEEEPEPEEEEKPAKKTAPAKKKVEKPVKKEVTKKTTKTAEKPAKKEEKKTSKRGKRLDPKNVAADRKEFDKLKKLFNEGYSYAWLSGAGVTIKHVGKNGNRGVLTIDNATKLDDGSVRCNLYLLTMTKQTDKLDELGIDYTLCWTNAPCMKGITLDEIVEILEKLYDDITSFVTTVDKRLGDNRKKMEENLKNSGKKSTKTAVTKKAKK